jgi:hypothetical protein
MDMNSVSSFHINSIEEQGTSIKAKFVSDKNHDCIDHIVIKIGEDITIFVNEIKDARLLRQRLNTELAVAITEYEDKLAGIAPAK